MATAEALMELVPNGNSRKNSTQNVSSAADDEGDHERVMAVTYAAYTKRAKLNAEKTKAQQLSKQLKTRLQFARLKVDYGWTRQSLNEVENLYFHLSRARPTPVTRTHSVATTEPLVQSTPPMTQDTSTESQGDTSAPSTQSTLIESQPESQPSSSSSFETHSQPQPRSPVPINKRPALVERTRTGGIVRSQPVERLRTGGRVRSPSDGASPRKRSRPRISDGSEPSFTSPVKNSSDGALTYDSFWSSLGSGKSSGA